MSSEDGSSITLKAESGIPAILVGDDPDRFFVPPYVGSKGWLGIRVAATVDWDEIGDLIRSSYCLIAPKGLARQVAAAT